MVDVGVVLPCAMPGVTADTTLEWARRIDVGPFASLAIPDRLDYPNWDPLLTLAAAAAATSRVRLMTAALLPPLRGVASLAKQVATLSALAGDRLVLGVAVGGRPVDYEAAGVPWERRGAILDEQLELLERLREPVDPDQDLGPRPGRVPILIGGASRGARRRLARWGAGYISGGVRPEIFGHELAACREAWAGAGRREPMRVVAVTWCASDERWERARTAKAAYYGKGGLPDPVSDELHRGADGVRRAVATFAELGADEVVFSSYVDDVDEVAWLADVVASL